MAAFRARGRGRRTVGGLLAAAGLVLTVLGLVPGSAEAASVAPELRDTNVKCADIQPDGVTWNELKINGVPENQTYADAGANDPDENPGDLVITITGATSTTFNWSSNGLDIEAVFVKGGQDGGGNLYRYPGTDDTSDTNLTTPNNPNGQPATISHVSFCYTGAAAVGSGDLVVSKDVVNGTGNSSFSFTVACEGVTLAAGDAAFTLADGQEHTISDLPEGTTCTVTETDSQGATTTHSVDGGTPAAGNSAEATIPDDDEATVAFVNTFTPAAGPVETTTTTTQPAATTTTVAPLVLGSQQQPTTTTTAAPAVLGTQQARALAATGATETRTMSLAAGLLLLLGAAMVLATRPAPVPVTAGLPAASVGRLLSVARLWLAVDDDGRPTRR